MRTTVTLDPDTAALVRRRMRESGLPFKRVLNDAIRAGLLEQQDRESFHTRAVEMGTPTTNLDRALQLAGDLEDDELVRKMRLRK